MGKRTTYFCDNCGTERPDDAPESANLCAVYLNFIRGANEPLEFRGELCERCVSNLFNDIEKFFIQPEGINRRIS